jgi:hypothetical protein
MLRRVMQVNGPTVANSVRLSGATHRARSTRRGATVDEEDEGEEEGRR